MIGRGDDADWRLPDPTRLVSSVHCAVDVADSAVRVRDLSRNGTTLDGLSFDGEAELRAGAVLGIGPYRLRAVADDDDRDDAGDASEAAERSSAVSAAPTAPAPLARPRSDDALALATRAALHTAARCERASQTWREALGAPVAPPTDGTQAFERLLDGELAPLERLEAWGDATAVHERAWLPAVQLALFRLLNELSPYRTEDEVGGINADARRWRHHRQRWESLATAGENGLLDAFMAHLADAYREQLEEARADEGSGTAVGR